MPPTGTGLSAYQLAQNLLQLVADGFVQRGVSLPAAQYVAPGTLVAYDEEQLTVNLNRIFGGEPGMEDDIQQPPKVHPYSAEFQVALVRTTPVVQDGAGAPILPSTAELQASAQQNMIDTETMRQVLASIRSNYTFVDRGMRMGVSPVVTVGPEGGIVGTVSTVTVPVM